MRKIISLHLRFALSCVLALLVFAGNSQAQTTIFTYQGSLVIGGSVASGSYDLQFKLYDQLAGGSLQGSPNTVTISGVTVTNGVFTMDLDFGAGAFPGAARYLEISVRPAGSGSFTTLSPRQQLTSTPYAIRSLNATSADTALNYSGSGASLTGLSASNISSGTLTDARLSSNVALLNAANTFTANQTINANLIQSGSLVQFTPTNGFVAGGEVATGSIPATGAGVRMMWYPNKYAFRAGQASGTEWDDANVGYGSVAFGDTAKASNFTSIAMGLGTTSSGLSAVAMGNNVTASGNYAVGIGSQSTASGNNAVALGESNQASGNNSVALGRFASTNGKSGSFVFNDTASNNILAASADDQFNVRATGGLRLFASTDTTDTTKPGLFISGTTGNTQINGNLTVSGSISGTFNGSGSSLTGLNASNISSGVLGIANGGTGSSTQNFVDLSSNQTGIGGNKTFTGLVAAGAFSGGGANLNNLNASSVNSGTLADARLSSNVALLNAVNTFTANQTVNANLIQSGTLVQFTPTDGFVAGGTFGSGSIPATGTGARMMWYPNKYAFRAGHVSGSQWDDANIGNGSVAMGYNATASGAGSVAIGNSATASGTESVAIGAGTTASGNNSVALGVLTTASGNSSVALGVQTTASGENSTALGSSASTNSSRGSFVYGDSSTTSTINATATNQFVVRAQQMWFGTNNSVTSTGGRFLETSTGAYLTSGGTWTNSSSRTLKTNFATINPRDVLQQVLRLPIQTWNYKAEDAKVRHIGAISQDFHGLFGFGDSAETISTVDADGVALAAIQGLHEELKDRDARISQQQQELGQLKARAGQLEQQVKQQQAVIDGLRQLLCAQQPQASVCQKP